MLSEQLGGIGGVPLGREEGRAMLRVALDFAQGEEKVSQRLQPPRLYGGSNRLFSLLEQAVRKRLK